MRVILLGVVLAIAAAAPANSFADDKQIADFIKAKLVQEKQRGNLFGFNVDMRVDRGTVWFKGFVSNRNQELMILRTAQLAGHLGVTQVVDDIEINQPAGPMAQSQPMPPSMSQAVQQRQSIMTSTQNPYGMPGQMPNMMPPQPMPQAMQQQAPMPQTMPPRRLPQTGPQMPMPQMPQMPRANVPSMPPRHSVPRSMPISQLDGNDEAYEGDAGEVESFDDIDTETQRVAYQQAVQNDERYQSPFATDRPATPFNSGYGYYNSSTDDPSFQDNLSRTVPASAAVPAAAMPAAGPPLPFARAAAAGANAGGGYGCQGGICGTGIAPPPAGGFGGGFGGGGGFAGSGGGGIAGGSANLPGYAWPSYAAHPNYGAVSYPKQYSPSAWPYIGPFYPYPQVPLGWRRVALEWDDGFWHLDFYDKNSSR